MHRPAFAFMFRLRCYWISTLLVAYTISFAQKNHSTNLPLGKGNNPFVSAYVEVNDHDFGCVKDYVYGKNHKQLFQIANIFAANLNADSKTGNPILSFNPNVWTVLKSDKIATLHSKGIKVILDILGNHQNAGWGCFTSYSQADSFALQCADAVKKYHLDGIDIDDEYSACTTNPQSLVMVLTALRKRLGMEKLISMVAFENHHYFNSIYQGKKAGDLLDLIIEENYDSTDYRKRIEPFLKMGISKNKLALGTHLENNDQAAVVEYVKHNGLAGVMVYGVTEKSREKLGPISKALHANSVIVLSTTQ